MRRFFHAPPALSDISRRVLIGSLTVWVFLLVSYVLLSCTYQISPRIDIRLLVCLSQYPLLILLCLTLGVTGALLLDLYVKFGADK